jgi:hypothetical protein
VNAARWKRHADDGAVGAGHLRATQGLKSVVFCWNEMWVNSDFFPRQALVVEGNGYVLAPVPPLTI